MAIRSPDLFGVAWPIANGLPTDFDRRYRTEASYLKDGKTETCE